MIPARDLPEEDPPRSGWAGTAGAPAAGPPPPEDEGTRAENEGTRAENEAGARPESNVPLTAWLRAGAAPGTGAGGTAGPGSAADVGSAAEPDSVAEPRSADGLVVLTEADAPAGPNATADAAAEAGPLADPARARIINAAAGGEAGDQWSEILAMFVDDPRGSVLEAAAVVDEAIDAFITTVREQQESLASSWEAKGTGTEELRQALQSYRKFWSSLVELGQPA